MAALNQSETKAVGEARDLLKALAREKLDLSDPKHGILLVQVSRLASELDTVYQMKGYYPS